MNTLALRTNNYCRHADMNFLGKGEGGWSHWQCCSVPWRVPWLQVHLPTFKTHGNSFGSCWKGQQNHTVTSQINCDRETTSPCEEATSNNSELEGNPPCRQRKQRGLAPPSGTWHSTAPYNCDRATSQFHSPDKTAQLSSMLAADDCSLYSPIKAAPTF